MTAAKDEILARIRSVDRGGTAPFERGYRRAGGLGPAERTQLFAERVADYRADVRVIESSEIAAAVGAALADHDAHRAAVPAGLPVGWRPSTGELVDDAGLTPRELDGLDGVVTGCTVAIAETGTIVLTGGESEGRRALSLVPDLHVCVVRSSQIVELVAEAVAVLDGLVSGSRRPLTFVSGPSATSDIELSRVEGVHGPRTLVVLIAKEESI